MSILIEHSTSPAAVSPPQEAVELLLVQPQLDERPRLQSVQCLLVYLMEGRKLGAATSPATSSLEECRKTEEPVISSAFAVFVDRQVKVTPGRH